MQFPLVQANSASEQPISGSLISNLYAAGVPKTSSISEVFCLLSIIFGLDVVNVGVIVVNTSNEFVTNFIDSSTFLLFELVVATLQGIQLTKAIDICNVIKYWNANPSPSFKASVEKRKRYVK